VSEANEEAQAMPAESVRLQWKSTVVAHCQIGQQLLYRWVAYFQSLALVYQFLHTFADKTKYYSAVNVLNILMQKK
jgi:hypothetical protein